MKFTLIHNRVIVGHDISIAVNAEGTEEIARVVTELDGFPLGDDPMNPARRVQYERFFHQAGTAAPGMEHTLIVSATNTKNKTQVASRQWKDPI